MITTYATCPSCGDGMWVRYHVYEGRAATFDSPAEPAEAVPVEWGCEQGCEPDQRDVQRALEEVTA